ncbi:MAG TPA: hypothetical protein VH482_01660 [Thermomicrobiales bacterium]
MAVESVAPSDVGYWAKPVTELDVIESRIPADAININVEGTRVNSPIQGFGRMWRKLHRVRLEGAEVTPLDVVKTWKEHFGEFWPKGNRFYGPLTRIEPGEVAVLNLNLMTPGGTKLSTGVLVLYADDESFTLMTPQGHIFSGWITFSSLVEDGVTIAQAEILMRASDPFYEVGMVLFGHRLENRFWEQTLQNVAARFGVQAKAQTTVECVDTRYQWRRVTNVWHNAAIRTALYIAATPVRRVGRMVRRQPADGPTVSQGV